MHHTISKTPLPTEGIITVSRNAKFYQVHLNIVSTNI